MKGKNKKVLIFILIFISQVIASFFNYENMGIILMLTILCYLVNHQAIY